MVTLLDVSAVAGHHAMPAALLFAVWDSTSLHYYLYLLFLEYWTNNSLTLILTVPVKLL